MYRSPEVIEDIIRTLEWNIVFGGGREEVLLKRREELLAEYRVANIRQETRQTDSVLSVTQEEEASAIVHKSLAGSQGSEMPAA